jgi:hypothetical protein
VSDDPASLGRRIARRYPGCGGRAELRELAAQLGIEVAEAQAPPPAQPGLRAEYQAHPPRITLYLAVIARLCPSLSEECDLVAVHLAHELFHHLESARSLPSLPPAASEAAAHAFVRELCGLSFDPGTLE